MAQVAGRSGQRARARTVRAPARHLWRLLSWAVTLAATAVMLLNVIGGHVLHYGLAPVLSASMRPTFDAGDAVLTRAVDVASLRPGQVAVFVPPGRSAAYAHRVIAVDGTPGHLTITTKGDANPSPDRDRSVLPGPQVAIVIGHLPAVGSWLVRLQDPGFRAGFNALMGLTFTAGGLGLILRRRPGAHRPSTSSTDPSAPAPDALEGVPHAV